MADFEFLTQNGWRLMTLGIGGAVGFAYIINRARREPDAQLPNRQAAGWIMIVFSLAAAIALTIWAFVSYGQAGGFIALLGAPLVAGLLVLLAQFGR